MKCIHLDCDRNTRHGICTGHKQLISQPNSLCIACWKCGSIEAIVAREEVKEEFGNIPELEYKKYIFVTECHKCNGGEKEKLDVVKGPKGHIL